jgi:hypothetical protein
VREAADQVESWLERPQVQIVHPGARHAELEYQATLHTADADFARYSGLRWKNPLG